MDPLEILGSRPVQENFRNFEELTATFFFVNGGVELRLARGCKGQKAEDEGPSLRMRHLDEKV